MMFLLWVAAMAVLLAVILFASWGAGGDPIPHTGADDVVDLLLYIQQVCEINGVDPLVVMAIIDRESNFEPDETNAATGCAGLMQLHPDTLDWICGRTGCRYNPYNPRANIAAGVYYLRWLLDRYAGNENMALLAYAEGHGGAEEMVYRDGVDPAETWQVRTIWARVERYNAEVCG